MNKSKWIFLRFFVLRVLIKILSYERAELKLWYIFWYFPKIKYYIHICVHSWEVKSSGKGVYDHTNGKSLAVLLFFFWRKYSMMFGKFSTEYGIKGIISLNFVGVIVGFILFKNYQASVLNYHGEVKKVLLSSLKEHDAILWWIIKEVSAV